MTMGLLLATVVTVVLCDDPVIRDWRLESVSPGIDPRSDLISTAILAVSMSWAAGAAVVMLGAEVRREVVTLRRCWAWPWRSPVGAIALVGVLVAAGLGMAAAAFAVLRDTSSSTAQQYGALAFLPVIAAALCVPSLRWIARRVLADTGSIHKHAPRRRRATLNWAAPLTVLVVVGLRVAIARLPMPVMSFDLVALANGVVTAGGLLTVVGVAVDDLLPSGTFRVRQDGTGAAARRWTAGVIIAVPTVLMMVLALWNPADVARMRTADPVDGEWSVQVPSAGGGYSIWRGRDLSLTWRSDRDAELERDVVLCAPDRCGVLFVPFFGIEAVTPDGQHLWSASWVEEIVEDPYRIDRSLRIRRDPMPTVRAGEDLTLGNTPDVDEVVEHTAVRYDLDLPEVANWAAERETPMAMAADEDHAVIATVARGPEGTGARELVIVRCTLDRCATSRTPAAVGDSEFDLSVRLGPDGSAIVLVDPGTLDDFAVQLVTVAADGSTSIEEVPVEIEYGYSWNNGTSLAVGPDGIVWVLVRHGLTGVLLRCPAGSCVSAESITIEGLSQGVAALVVDSTGRPLIVSHDPRDDGLTLVSCRDAQCSTQDRRRLAEPIRSQFVDEPVVLALDGDLPVIGRLRGADFTGDGRVILRCDAPRCGMP
ncbi:hypothetical protein [Cellulomonas sp. NPDC089187]|uniref:hypothetical protein n=1 Tax=Cellulomonas sp. NPDC089187 TaxID=3154970 RepID=UPI003434CC17